MLLTRNLHMQEVRLIKANAQLQAAHKNLIDMQMK
jgi:hypothetical protein